MRLSRSRRWRKPSARTPTGSRSESIELAGHRRIGELGADRGRIDEVVDVAMRRPELSQMTPGEVERSDLAGILEAAW